MSDTSRTKRLLLINSNDERLETLQNLLNKSEKYEIVTANNSKDAVDILKTKTIDFVISNIQLEGIDGWRLARLIRAGVLRCAPNIPYIIISNTWCEHIAKTTAREFLVNQLVAYEDYPNLLKLVDTMQPSPIEDIERASLLVVEDNPDTRHLVKRILKRRFKVDAAENGNEGIELWEKGDYDLVLLDIMLPGITGIEILDRIMNDKPDQSVVMMTANHTTKLVEELMLKGAADFIAKPFHAEQLRQVCETAARREDFIISSSQFAEKVKLLNKSRHEYKLILDSHQHLLDQISCVVIELTTNGTILFLNHAWERLTGFSIKHSIGQPLIEFIENTEQVHLLNPENIGLFVADSSTSNHFEFRMKNRNNQDLWVEARFEITLAKDRKSRAISGTIEDITERKNAQIDLEYLAMHDDLTQLFNRHYFEIELKNYAASAARGNGPHAILYVNLDHFKIINDTLGHHHGDQVIKDTAAILQSRMRDSDILARVGGDEFGLILPNTNQHIAQILADDLCRLVDEYPCCIDGKSFKTNCSIGISEIKDGQHSYEEYMKQADIALYAAKKQGRNRVHIYNQNDVQSNELENNFEWARRLHEAVADDKLILHFQPIIQIDTLETSYYEALVRLKIDDELILPGEFIPALERENAMTLLDRHVIRKAFKYLAENPKLKKISINLSAQGFGDEHLLPLLKENLETYQVSPDRIIFELTESASLNNINATKEIVTQISQLGFEFSIDDFGTGFSTFNYLKQIPVQSVKIDGSFVVDLAQNPIDLALVKAIYEVATALDKQTVAEFVENEASLNILKEIGVTYAQGFYFSKPKPVEELFD